MTYSSPHPPSQSQTARSGGDPASDARASTAPAGEPPRVGGRRRVPREALAGRRGGGHPIVAEVVAAVRGLVEGSVLPYAAIAARTGVSRTTICRWRKRGRWPRPTGAPAFAEGDGRPARRRRGRGRIYAGDAVGGVRDLATGSLLSQAAIAARVGISQERVSAWIRRHGWVRPRVPRGSKRFAAASRTGERAAAGDRRGRPYAPDVRREARFLWEETRLSTALIGARVGAHPGTVARWSREEGWERPPGRVGAGQLRGFFGAVMGRSGARGRRAAWR